MDTITIEGVDSEQLIQKVRIAALEELRNLKCELRNLKISLTVTAEKFVVIVSGIREIARRFSSSEFVQAEGTTSKERSGLIAKVKSLIRRLAIQAAI